MPFCAVDSCKNTSRTTNFAKDGVRFHSFPRDPHLKKEWIKACGRNFTWVPKRTSTICSLHFEKSQYLENKKKKKDLAGYSIPTLFLPRMEGALKCSEDRQDLVPKSEPEDIQEFSIQSTEEIIADPLSLKTDSIVANQLTPNIVISIETQRSTELVDKLKMKNKIIKRLRARISYLENKVATLQNTLNDS